MKSFTKNSNLCCLFLAAALLSSVAGVRTAHAGPVGEAIEGTANVAKELGGTVLDTTKAVGGSITGAVDTLAGNVTPTDARKEIDDTAKLALKRLLSENSQAKALFDKSYGYAIFDTRKFSFLITTGGGAGVAVERSKGNRSYMRMLSGGANLGGGVQFYQIVFLFENQASFENFVDHGWEASGNAGAVLGKDSLEAGVKFVEGKAIYHLTDTGILLGADLSGTKYWKSGKLNAKG